MISYKKIDILNIRRKEDNKLYHKDKEFNIKSPIIIYEIKDSILELKINKHSESHNTFLNICSYIERLFTIKEVETKLTTSNTISININNESKFYDENSKHILKNNLNKEGKCLFSFKYYNGNFILNHFY
jgi:hypothetical protein